MRNSISEMNSAMERMDVHARNIDAASQQYRKAQDDYRVASERRFQSLLHVLGIGDNAYETGNQDREKEGLGGERTE